MAAGETNLQRREINATGINSDVLNCWPTSLDREDIVEKHDQKHCQVYINH